MHIDRSWDILIMGYIDHTILTNHEIVQQSWPTSCEWINLKICLKVKRIGKSHAHGVFVQYIGIEFSQLSNVQCYLWTRKKEKKDIAFLSTKNVRA